jgi:hypothetical protein
MAQAIANMDQSYSFSGLDGHSTGAAGSFFEDTGDFCDTADGQDDPSYYPQTSKCVTINGVQPLGEGAGAVP